MSDADLELRIADWLNADAATSQTPGTLRRRVLDLPSQAPPREAWWHRFAGLPAMTGAVAAASLVAILVANSFFTLFDAPAGADGDPCNNRQVQRALDELRDADGYRYMSTEQVRALDSDAEISFDNPTFIWRDAWVSEGAYLAPDRTRDVPVTRTDALDRGYLEHLQVDGHTYQLSEIDGEPTWVEQTNWPTANWVWGYLANQFPAFSIPGATALSWDAAVPADLPGQGGCTAAARLPDDYGPHGRIAALRVNVGTGRVMTTSLGPATDVRANEGDTRSSWELTWELPSADEFVAPADPQPDPNVVGSNATAPPTPTPVAVDPDAWQPVALPLTQALEDARSFEVSSVVRGDRWVAVGSAYGDSGSLPAIWTSADGVTWEAVDGLNAMRDISPIAIAWDGTEYLLLGYRHQATEDSRPESWISTDGVTWEAGGPVGPPMGSGEVANPGSPVAAGPGWIAGGSISSQAPTGQEYRPAFFWSADGREWTTVELDGTRTGRLQSPLVLPDGSLLALGCESPSAASTGSGDCYVRPWRSDDGVTWEVGPIIPSSISGPVVRDGRILALVSDEPVTDEWASGGQILVSDDGETWESFAELPSDGAPGTIHVTDTTLVVGGSVATVGGHGRAVAWRYGEGGSWERIDLAPPIAGVGIYLGGVVETEAGLVMVGFTSDTDTGAGSPYLWIEP